MKKIYLIRHCEAEGQPAEATLTNNGFQQADQLAEFFRIFLIDRINPRVLISVLFKR